MTTTLKATRLGKTGPISSAMGLGCMGMSDMYGPADETESIATIHAAMEAGVTLLDTGDFYGMGHNEMLIRRALEGRRRADVLLSVKFGAMRGPDGGWLGFDTRPAAVKTALAYSLRRLGTDYIDIYRPSRVDQAVPIEDTIGAIKDMIDAGYVRHIGLSEAGPTTLRRAQAVHPIVDLQIEYAVITRGIEARILPTARELGISVTAYGVLGRGLIGGHLQPGALTPGDMRGHTPRFQGENLTRNIALAETLRRFAAARGLTVAQLAIAWVTAQGADIVPLVGARRRDRLAEALGGLSVVLSADDLAELSSLVPPDAVAGTRYAAHSMAMLDTEHGR